jgi:hypothetical protein
MEGLVGSLTREDLNALTPTETMIVLVGQELNHINNMINHVIVPDTVGIPARGP